MKSQSLFSGKSKKNITSLSFAECAERVVKVQSAETLTIHGIEVDWLQSPMTKYFFLIFLFDTPL